MPGNAEEIVYFTWSMEAFEKGSRPLTFDWILREYILPNDGGEEHHGRQIANFG